MTDIAKERLVEFKQDLKVLSPIDIVRKHILHGECCILSQHEYFDLRSRVADHFELHPNEVLVVGSTKLGFSIAPGKPYRPFSDRSDIDVVLVSSTLFEKFWSAVFSYKNQGGYWPEFSQFSNYLFQGWMRPDKLPRTDMIPLGKEWWEFFRNATSSSVWGDYKITGAIYKSYFFLENYQKICVQQCKDKNCKSNSGEHDESISE